MLRRLALASSLVVIAAGSAIAGNTPAPGPRFDGLIKVLELNGDTCPGALEGEEFSATYRLKPGPNSQREEAISIAIPAPPGALYLAAAGDGTFAGSNQKAVGTVIIDAWRAGIQGVVVNLTFQPGAPQAGDPGFEFQGKVKNYLFKGCNAKISGQFVAR